MHFSSLLVSVLVPAALAKDGCAQYMCRDMITCTQTNSNNRQAVVSALNGGLKPYLGRDGALVSELKANANGNGETYMEKTCHRLDTGIRFRYTNQVVMMIWRSPYRAGNFYVDYTSSDPKMPNNQVLNAVRVRGWCEMVKRVDC